MRMMLVCENEADKEAVKRVFENMVHEREKYGDVWSNHWEGGVTSHEHGCTDIYPTDAPIVYAYTGDSYTVYNFHTGKKTENVEGDLAGLCNLPEEDFPNM